MCPRSTDADPGLLTDYVFALLSNNENITEKDLTTVRAGCAAKEGVWS